ncbi:hypothetical protein VNO77_15967 [Canavalia gladiata]|uniref:Uncharacterized protein n=1 Tax=Canavalia gladiata TaxID=3824 RepID=A0AAN9QRK5_CANGL
MRVRGSIRTVPLFRFRLGNNHNQWLDAVVSMLCATTESWCSFPCQCVAEALNPRIVLHLNLHISKSHLVPIPLDSQTTTKFPVKSTMDIDSGAEDDVGKVNDGERAKGKRGKNIMVQPEPLKGRGVWAERER